MVVTSAEKCTPIELSNWRVHGTIDCLLRLIRRIHEKAQHEPPTKPLPTTLNTYLKTNTSTAAETMYTDQPPSYVDK